ncbi:MAG TPA: terminase family protein [Magnetospirillum sp.]|nr:terminase family protein [Magnetospirillum sp.]
MTDEPVTVWAPQPGPQTALLTCPLPEVCYGGARFGGKTDGVLGEWASHAAEYGKDAIGLMVRRQRTELVETIERSKVIYGPLGAVYQEQKSMWTFPGGGRLRFAYLERDSDANAYQGHSYSRIYVEECGNFPSPTPILKLKGTLRSGAGVPCRMLLTCNPGGPGHGWVKARYIDPAPMGYTPITETFVNPWTHEKIEMARVFIPSLPTDNKFLTPEYIATLQQIGNDNLVKAWLFGDWNIIDGAFFDRWSHRNVVKPFEVPADWLRFRAADWGFSAPFSMGWYAVAGDDAEDFGIPRGCLVRYRELYTMRPGQPNVGLRLTTEQLADDIKRMSGAEKYAYSVIDPAAFAESGGPSIAERFARRGVAFKRADNRRLGSRGAMAGWDLVRARIQGEDDRPMFVTFSTCTELIRTLPVLQHDPVKAEDLDTTQEDHCADELRYAVTSRPWVAKKPTEPEPPRTIQNLTMNEAWTKLREPMRAGRI